MGIIRDLLVFIGAMFAMCIVLIIVVSRLPDENPLKRLLNALTYRVGATLLAGVVAVPVEPIPGLDVLYDLAVPVALVWYRFTFFRDTLRSPTVVSPRSLDRKRIRCSRPSLSRFARHPNRTAKLPNGELGTRKGPSFSKTRSLRPLGPTLPRLSPGYSATISEA